MSTTSATFPIIGCLTAIEKYLGPDRKWTPTNDRQWAFLVDYFAQGRHDVGAIRDILNSIAARSVEPVNAFLRERGFTIQLRPLPSDGIAAASMLDVKVEWEARGRKVTITDATGKTFPGVRIPGTSVDIVRRSNHPNPIARLTTKSGERAYLTVCEDEKCDVAQTVAKLRTRAADSERSVFEFDGVQFPMVDLNHEVDCGWLAGMATTGDDDLPAIISQALQQTKFKMNEIGARAQSAAAVGVLRGGPSPNSDLIINRPFLIWIERDKVSQPLFVGHITPDDWKDPGTL